MPRKKPGGSLLGGGQMNAQPQMNGQPQMGQPQARMPFAAPVNNQSMPMPAMPPMGQGRSLATPTGSNPILVAGNSLPQESPMMGPTPGPMNNMIPGQMNNSSMAAPQGNYIQDLIKKMLMARGSM